MLQVIVQSHEPLSKLLSAFRETFRNQPQYRHFQAYVLALLIHLGSHNLTGLSRAISNGRKACNCSDRWDATEQYLTTAQIT